MIARDFLDSNVIVYAHDVDEPEKQAIALALLDDALKTRAKVVSTQVLQEFYVSATTKLGVDPAEARQQVSLLTALDVVVVTPAMVLAAIDLARLQQIHYYDALIVKCAAAAGCKRLLTEDLQDGATIDGVKIVNPFATPPSGGKATAPSGKKRR